MAKRNGPPTADDTEHNETTIPNVSRRRLLQISGIGLAAGTAGAAGVSANTGELPHSIIIDGSGSSETAAYEFLTSGSVAAHPDRGSNDSVSGNDGHVTNTLTTETHAYQFSGTLSYLDVEGTAEVKLLYGDDEPAKTDRLQIVAGSDATIDYEITSNDTVTKVLDAGDRSANDGDSITETSDGWVVDGSTANGSGDTYDFAGEIESIDPVAGNFTVFLNGEETTVTDLTGQEADTEETDVERKHWYSIESTGDSFVDYYIEVKDGGNMIASTVNDAIIEADFNWINEDATMAAGRVQAGDTHAFAFDTNLLDVTIEGEANAMVNGVASNLDYYPQEGATGDHWKGYFPWHLDGEERTHWYSVGATGEEYVDYYIEVKDGGAMIPSTVNDAIVEYVFFWISQDGTKAAGRVQPGDTHAFTFDTNLLDVTIEGEADAMVNDVDSNLDYYPQEGATGDSWKSGFPWQDEGDGVSTTEASGDGTIGGGTGYANTVPQSAADVTVSTESELDSALENASSGDVVYVSGNATISVGDVTFDVPDGVTLASNRGVDGAEGGLIECDAEPYGLIEMDGDSRVTGLRITGAHPGDDFDGDAGVGVMTYGPGEVDNCHIRGWAYSGVRCLEGDSAHVHHNVIVENNRGGLGYGVAADAGTPIIEYNYMNYNRHSVATAGDSPGYVCRYNHFGSETTDHIIDVHDPAGERYEIHNNVVEAVEAVEGGGREGLQRPAVTIRGAPDDIADIYDNWFFNPDEPLDEPSGWTEEAITQAKVDDWTNVSFSGNAYGEDANVSYSDIIPGYDGWRS